MLATTAETRITQSRVRLLMNKPFFGTLATRLRIQEVESMPTAATDGRHFFFNREFVDALDDEELDFLVGHEVLHCVYDHMESREDREPMLYNVACELILLLVGLLVRINLMVVSHVMILSMQA
jgi:predicted metal-dependent peptidase